MNVVLGGIVVDFRVKVFFIATVIIYLIVIIQLLKKNKLELKYTLLWLIAALILIVVTILPGTVYYISELLGIVTPINSALVLAGMFVITILIVLTSIVSELNKTVRVLTQKIAILEKQIREELGEKENK